MTGKPRLPNLLSLMLCILTVTIQNNSECRKQKFVEKLMFFPVKALRILHVAGPCNSTGRWWQLIRCYWHCVVCWRAEDNDVLFACFWNSELKHNQYTGILPACLQCPQHFKGWSSVYLGGMFADRTASQMGLSSMCPAFVSCWCYLWPPYGIGQAIIFLPCGFFFCLSIYLLSPFSSPNLSRHRLDVCHTSTHGVALVQI